MKQFILVFSLLAFGASVSFAQTTPTAEPTQVEEATTTDAPTMTFEQEVIDYGTIEYNSDPFRYFSFTNTGTEPLLISNVESVPTEKSLFIGGSGK